MSDDIIQKLRDAPRRPDCKHGNRPKSCLECEIEELEAEATASMTEIANLRAENESLRKTITIIGKLATGHWTSRDDPLSDIRSLAYATLKGNSDD